MIDYDTSRGIIATASQLRSTVIPLVFLKLEFYFLLGMNLGITYLRRTGQFEPDDAHVQLSMKLTQTTGALMTFFVVFYNGNVFSRYLKLYELTKGMCENCLYIVSCLMKELQELDMVRKMTRLLLASAFMFFIHCTRAADPTVEVLVEEQEWDQLRNLGLLEDNEITYLDAHCRKLKRNAVPSFICMHWSMKLYRTQIQRVPDIDKYYFAARKCQEDVAQMMELPMPFQYFHIMNLMLMLNLMLWAYALALQESYFGPAIFFFVQLMFQGLREMSIALSDPFGDDETDFPLNEWMTGLYLRLYEIVEQDFSIMEVTLYENWPLTKIKEGQTVTDVLSEVRERPVERPKRKTVVRQSEFNKPRGRRTVAQFQNAAQPATAANSAAAAAAAELLEEEMVEEEEEEEHDV